MERYSRSVWKGTTESVRKGTAGQYGKVQQVSMGRYGRSVLKGTAGQ